jgi:thermitase
VRRVSLLCLLALLLVCGVPAGASAAEPSRAELQRLQDEGVRDIIVARDPGLSATTRGELRTAAGVAHVANLRLADTEVVRAPAGGLVAALDALSAEPGVRYAEPNGIVRAATNDVFWADMWALENAGQTVGGVTGTPDADVDAPQAWTLSTGAGQTVAVVDTGTTFGQEDLQGVAATNPGETGGGRETNGVDDDHDGFVDDWRGWDFVGNGVVGDNDPTDLNGHGTHVTGTIAARKDNALGIAGVAPAARVLTLRALGADGTGTNADIANAFKFAGDRGIRIVNASIETNAFSQTVENAIAQHPGTLYVVAAGNSGANDDTPASATFPCALQDANVVCVGASDQNDARADFSNFGRTSVDPFAPGVNVGSTFPDSTCPAPPPGQPPAPPGGCYAFVDGTSMAAPHVAGTLALMLAANPALSAGQLKAELLASVDPRPGLAGDAVTGGRLNAATAVSVAAGSPPAGTPAPDPPAAAPAPAPPAPAPAPTAPAASAPPAAAAAVAPVLGRPGITAGALTATRALTIRFTLDRAATVRLTVSRIAGGRARRVATVVLQGRTGANRYVLRARVGGRRLARGRYRLRLQAVTGGRAYTLTLTVR